MSKRMKSRLVTLFRRLMLVVALAAVFTLFAGFITEKSIYLISDGDLVYTIDGYTGDFSEAFVRAGIVLGGDDSYEAVQTGNVTRIDITRRSLANQKTYESIAHTVIRRSNPELPVGTELVTQEGKDGIRATETQVISLFGGEGEEYFRGVSNVALPVDEIIEYGTGVRQVSQSPLSVTSDVLTAVDQETGTITTLSGKTLTFSKALTCTATAYTTERQAWKITATGTTARIGAIAVDPRVIPYGTRMFIVSADGSITYGIATAEDCGGAIKGNKIDLFFNTYDECIQFGRRPCTVYILS